MEKVTPDWLRRGTLPRQDRFNGLENDIRLLSSKNESRSIHKGLTEKVGKLTAAELKEAYGLEICHFIFIKNLVILTICCVLSCSLGAQLRNSKHTQTPTLSLDFFKKAKT